MKSKLLLIPLVLLVVGGALVLLRSPEDDWICQNGKWVKHGNPSFAEPSFPCGIEGQKATATQSGQTGLPNPASQSCLNKGGKLEIIKETAGELGICKFSDGTQCEEWQLFRGECQKGQYKTADTSHPYSGLINKSGQEYKFKSDTGVEYLLKLPENFVKSLQERLIEEVGAKEPVIIVASETPPLSKTLILKGFQEK